MSEIARRRRRTDADRSAGAILRAAKEILAVRPHAHVEEIAAAASVSRQTVYAHFRSREGLVSAVIDAIAEEATSEMDAARLDEGPATDALLRLLDASWRTAQRYSVLLSTPDVSPRADRLRHIPVHDQLTRVLTRGQAAGEFTTELSAGWLATAIVSIGHAAGEAFATGRMTFPAAVDTLAATALRICRP
ncbi:MAG: helix-turn-helix domain-containing protein [Kibdelosporangium sp.]